MLKLSDFIKEFTDTLPEESVRHLKYIDESILNKRTFLERITFKQREVFLYRLVKSTNGILIIDAKDKEGNITRFYSYRYPNGRFSIYRKAKIIDKTNNKRYSE